MQRVAGDSHHRIKQVRITLLTKSFELAGDLLRIISPIGDDLGVIVITDDQQLVTIVNLISEFERGRLKLFDVSANRQRIIY